MTQTAKELQTLIADLRGLDESGPVAQRVEAISAQLQGVLKEGTDHGPSIEGAFHIQFRFQLEKGTLLQAFREASEPRVV
jgi:hypothetical protein